MERYECPAQIDIGDQQYACQRVQTVRKMLHSRHEYRRWINRSTDAVLIIQWTEIVTLEGRRRRWRS